MNRLTDKLNTLLNVAAVSTVGLSLYWIADREGWFRQIDGTLSLVCVLFAMIFCFTANEIRQQCSSA